MKRTNTTDKASVKNGRAKRGGEAYNANHNTLEVTRLNQAHIDAERIKYNQYVKYNADGKFEKIKAGKGGFDSKKHELELYEHFYGKGLKAKNDRHLAQRHEDRCQEMKDIYSNPKTAPLETIFQVGSRESVIDRNKKVSILTNAWNATLREVRKRCGENFVPADAALHMDEAEPHIHFRSLLMARDKFGDLVPNQTQALEAMGFERPDPSKPKSRYNNALVTFTDYVRETFYRECERQGIQINREVENPSKRQVSILEHKCEKMKQEVQAAEERAAQSRQEAQEAAITKQTVEEQVQTLRDDITALRGSQAALEHDKQTLTTENDTLRTRCKELETEIKGLEIQLSEINKQREQAEKDKKKAEAAKKQAEEAKQQAESEKAQAEAEKVQAQKDRATAVEKLIQIEQHGKNLFRNSPRKLRIFEELPAQGEKTNWKGKVTEEAKPARTVVATEDLEHIYELAKYHVDVDYNRETIKKLDGIMRTDKVKELEAKVADLEKGNREKQWMINTLRTDKKNLNQEIADRQNFMWRTGLEDRYQYEQRQIYEQSQDFQQDFF